MNDLKDRTDALMDSDDDTNRIEVELTPDERELITTMYPDLEDADLWEKILQEQWITSITTCLYHASWYTSATIRDDVTVATPLAHREHYVSQLLGIAT